MKLLFGLLGAAMMLAFLASFVIKVKEPSMMAVAAIGIVMMLIDLWQAYASGETIPDITALPGPDAKASA